MKMTSLIRKGILCVTTFMMACFFACGPFTPEVVPQSTEEALSTTDKELSTIDEELPTTEEDTPEASLDLSTIDTILPEELESITVSKLSPEHEFYQEVVTLDPECADYIREISIYDKEIDDTFVVHVSLPPDYEENVKYPMVLMTDGVWRLSDHPELRPMMANGEVQKVILASVGYPNGYDYRRIRERDLYREPENYLHFIVDNLVPYLKAVYPVSDENMTLTGHSYGGYWAYYALFHSDLIGQGIFANYYIGSPSVQARTDSLNLYDFEEQYYERNKALNANVYVTVGGLEESYFISAIEKFDEQVLSRNYEGLTFTYELIPDETHNTVFKPSIRNTLLMFYKNE